MKIDFDSMTSTTNAWIACSSPKSQAQLRLFCFPYAGGGASIFYRWARLLPPTIEVCAIRLPGRENRLTEAPYTQFAPLIETLADKIQPYLDKPFAFFGHSMGAILCFELARQLRRHHLPNPVRLFISAFQAPQVSSPRPSMQHLSDAEFVTELQQFYNSIPEVVLNNAELMELFLPILRADLTIVDNYTYTAEDPFDYPISVFGGEQDSLAADSHLHPWRHHTSSAFKLEMFPGDHFFLHSQQQRLLQTIVKELGKFLY